MLFIAFKLWTASTAEEEVKETKSKNQMELVKQEFLIAAGNPKAILIFTAFLPQFIDPSQNVASQFTVLGTLFLMLEVIALAGYALIGLHLRRWFNQPKGKRLFNRICAVLLSGAATLLLTARRS